MSHAVKVLQGTLRRLLIVQAGLILASATAYFFAQGGAAAVAAAFGGAIALLNALVSAHHLKRASVGAAGNAQRGMLELYLGAVIRFIATPLLVAVGIVALGLAPVPMLVAFAVAQVAYFAGPPRAPASAEPN